MYPNKADFSNDYPWDKSKSGPLNRDSQQLWAENGEKAFEAGRIACVDGKGVSENPHVNPNDARWWKRGWEIAYDLAHKHFVDYCANAYKPGETDFDPDNLVAGNMIVMWDGKYFGVYVDLPAAIRDARIRITEQNCHTLPGDYECLEFLEVLDKDAGCLRDLRNGPCRNEHGTRISFDHPVKDLGNQISKFRSANSGS